MVVAGGTRFAGDRLREMQQLLGGEPPKATDLGMLLSPELGSDGLNAYALANLDTISANKSEHYRKERQDFHDNPLGMAQMLGERLAAALEKTAYSDADIYLTPKSSGKVPEDLMAVAQVAKQILGVGGRVIPLERTHPVASRGTVKLPNSNYEMLATNHTGPEGDIARIFKHELGVSNRTYVEDLASIKPILGETDPAVVLDDTISSGSSMAAAVARARPVDVDGRPKNEKANYSELEYGPDAPVLPVALWGRKVSNTYSRGKLEYVDSFKAVEEEEMARALIAAKLALMPEMSNEDLKFRKGAARDWRWRKDVMDDTLLRYREGTERFMDIVGRDPSTRDKIVYPNEWWDTRYVEPGRIEEHKWYTSPDSGLIKSWISARSPKAREFLLKHAGRL